MVKVSKARSAKKKIHDGDLGHNSTVWYEDQRYICWDGSDFYAEEVRISDRTNCATLTPGEALSLLEWLQQEKSKLQQLQSDDASTTSPQVWRRSLKRNEKQI